MGMRNVKSDRDPPAWGARGHEITLTEPFLAFETKKTRFGRYVSLDRLEPSCYCTIYVYGFMFC